MRKLELIVLALGISGVLFAGYLSAVKFFSESCAFNESCPYFLGYPACYYGLAMYVGISVFALLCVLRAHNERPANSIIIAISALGILFSGYFTALELPLLFSEGFAAYVLGLPTCAMGLVMYVIIFILSVIVAQKSSLSAFSDV